ncbi:metallophosphoesterase [Amaricoccus tamworthensis]|uniref:metallophosphoesterase n=1 Tax=Amaricoccus tamworthensis TaxID=57002 RepID=UPI003C7C5CEF
MTVSTDGQRIYAVGDIHGEIDLLMEMTSRITDDMLRRPHRNPRVVFIGDYNDRGPNSRAVYEFLIGLQDSSFPVTCLLGNHDSYILTYLDDPIWVEHAMHWMNPRLGGDKTLASYGVHGATEDYPADSHAAFEAAFPERHRLFIANCEQYLKIGDYVFVHAGIRPGVPLEKQSLRDLIMIRDPFLNSTLDHGFKVVHGHTISENVEHHSNRIGIDTGAFRTGRLSCVVLEDEDVSLLDKDSLKPWPKGSGLGIAKKWAFS